MSNWDNNRLCEYCGSLSLRVPVCGECEIANRYGAKVAALEVKLAAAEAENVRSQLRIGLERGLRERAESENARLRKALDVARRSLGCVVESGKFEPWTHPKLGLQDPCGVHSAYDVVSDVLRAPKSERKEPENG